MRKITTYILYLFLLPALILTSLNVNAQFRGDLKESLERASNDSQKINAYKHLLTYYKYVNTDSAIYYAEQGLQFAISKKYLMGQGIMISQLGLIDQGEGRTTLASQRIAYALQIFRQQNYLQGVAAMENSLGSIEATKGNYEIAIKYFESALKMHESIVDDEGLMTSYMNLGALFLQHSDTGNAAKYLSMAEEVSKKLPVVEHTVSLYNYIGILYATEGDKEKARQYFEHDVAISNTPKLTNVHVESLLYLGSFYNDLGNTDQALQYLNDGLRIAKANVLQEQEANILLELAGIYKNKNAGLAMNYLEDAMVICDNMRSKPMLVKLFKEMGDIYEGQGKYKDALRAYKTQQNIADSISGANKAIEVSSLGATYELKRSNDKLRKMEIAGKAKDRQRNMIIVASLLVGAVLLVIVFLYLKTIRLNRKLVANEKDLNDLNNTKNKLFSIIGHDLRWPVARIPQVLEMADHPTTSAEDRVYLLDSLNEHTNAIVETLDKLLYWGQSIVKGVNMKPANFKPRKYTQQSIRLKKMTTEDKEIVMTDNVPAALEAYSDPAHFDFILRNLLGNAIKFTPVKGHIEIGALEDRVPGYVVIYVKDNGVGMTKERLARIFEPFDSKDGTASEKGTGIGLMLCKEFALKNGGDIWAESELGEGTTFYYSVKKRVKEAETSIDPETGSVL